MTPPPPLRPAQSRNRGAIAITAITVLIVVLGAIWWLSKAPNKPPAQAVFRRPAGHVPSQHQDPIGTGTVTVNANAYTSVAFPVPAGASNTRVTGHFRASGDNGNDIEVLLLDAIHYADWKNGASVPTYYNSGDVTADDINAALPDGGGTFYLIFNNKFSPASPKSVEQRLSVRYFQ